MGSAERYAKLLGRPHARTGKGLCKMRREKFHPASIYDLGGAKHHDPSSTASTTASECSTPLSTRPAAPMLSIAAQLEGLDTVQCKLEKEESLVSLQVELEDQKLSALHKRASAEGADQAELAIAMDAESQKDAYIQLILAKVREKSQKQPAAMPLALRRVVASLLPKNETQVLQGSVDDLRSALGASAHTIQKSQRMQRKRSP